MTDTPTTNRAPKQFHRTTWIQEYHLQHNTRCHRRQQGHSLPSQFSPLREISTIDLENCSLNVGHVISFYLSPFHIPCTVVAKPSPHTDFFVARGVFYPIQFCVYSDASLFTWFEWMFHDEAYLESVLLGMSAMDDFVRQAPPSKLTYSHMKSTITALNNRLSDSTLYLTDSTIAVVMGLADLREAVPFVGSQKHAPSLLCRRTTFR